VQIRNCEHDVGGITAAVEDVGNDELVFDSSGDRFGIGEERSRLMQVGDSSHRSRRANIHD
jgi:hypothetical protein